MATKINSEKDCRGTQDHRYHGDMSNENTPTGEGITEALKEKGVELEVIKFTDPDDDFNEPLPERTCNLDDEECESCQ